MLPVQPSLLPHMVSIIQSSLPLLQGGSAFELSDQLQKGQISSLAVVTDFKLSDVVAQRCTAGDVSTCT